MLYIIKKMIPDRVCYRERNSRGHIYFILQSMRALDRYGFQVINLVSSC